MEEQEEAAAAVLVVVVVVEEEEVEGQEEHQQPKSELQYLLSPPQLVPKLQEAVCLRRCSSKPNMRTKNPY